MGTANEMDPQQAIPVDSVAQEYAILASHVCTCGGPLRPLRQALLSLHGCYYDLLEAACQHCGARRQLLFDIHTFFGQSEAGLDRTTE